MRDDFHAVDINDVYENMLGDEIAMNSVEYALSTLYYSMSATVSGGSKSEKRGNRLISKGGYALTTRDREAFRTEADRIRRRLGLDVEESATGASGMYDASHIQPYKLKLR